MKICIVGGGASGLMAAINIKRDDNEVIILEYNEEVGKKILVTGNGRCNLWNEEMNISKYNSYNKEQINNHLLLY
ncbi:MAG: NAD(P)/FAD-dependent oxidoreductase [Bacilli bacterium]|nr:NAD(P)/FAD-dependent oxidoreductase [Bacilli bacterium]